MKKIALFTPMLQPYRLTFYEKLDRFSPDAEWIFFHGTKRSEDGRPAYTGKTSFRNTGLVEKIQRIGPFRLLIHEGLFQEVVKFNPDMIIIQSVTGNLSYRKVVNWAKKNNKIILNWTCAWDPGLAKGILLKLKNHFVSTFYADNHAFLTYSTRAIEYVMQRGVERSRIVVCYNGIETDNMVLHENEIIQESENIIGKLNLKNFTVFLYVGGLVPEKRTDLLVEAFRVIREQNESVKLLIIGDGPLKEQLLGKIKQLDDENIIYLGRIIDNVDPYFAASTCLVLPGTGGLALNQAMFWRKICIAGEADGTEDDLVIDGKTGFRFEKDDLDSLIEAMQKVIRTDELQREQMGNQSRDIILNKSNVNHMVEVFTQTIVKFFPELGTNSTVPGLMKK
jgi:glycosyltransferase involved in cell wall biosynthesis